MSFVHLVFSTYFKVVVQLNVILFVILYKFSQIIFLERTYK